MICIPKISLETGDLLKFDDGIYELQERKSDDTFDVKKPNGEVEEKHTDWFSNKSGLSEDMTILR